MTYEDLVRIEPGDSIIGLGNRWDDELPIVAVGRLEASPSGSMRRRVIARISRALTTSAFVVEDDLTIRGARWSAGQDARGTH